MSNHHFKTEVSRLLDLIVHSLYSHKEIFLRELISNASDAIDKQRYLRLSDEAYKSLAFDPDIEVSIDNETKTLTVTDNGIGMDEKELEENLGTIARSGTRNFLEKMPDTERKDSNLIGQFGVGFYSAFMVADKVEVTSRKAGSDRAFVWSSAGKGEYSVDPAVKAGQGTEIKVHLNDEGSEYLSRWKVEEVLKKYSNHIAYPIRLVSMEGDYDDKGKKKGDKKRDERVNAASALWRRPKSELKDEDYAEFYKSFTGTDEAPLHWVHTRAEGSIEYSTLFFFPSKAPFDLYRADYKPGVKLYVRRVFITDDEKELLPTYLRFVRGVIDSEDLPLNVSREILQQNKVMNSIRQASVKKILGELTDMSTKNSEKFLSFIGQFNRLLKEGLYGDYANRDTLLGLARWKSTGVDGWTSFADYKSRIKEGQKSIYYIAGNDEERLRRSPLLEMYRKNGFEVLVCSDEIDEIVLSALGPVLELELKSVNRSGSESEIETKEAEKPAEEREAGEKAVAAAKKILGESVKDVRLSRRLAESPSCVVVDSDDPTLQFREMMKQFGGSDFPEVKPILELNGGHELVRRLASAEGEAAEDLARVLLDQALIMEGAPLADPASFVQRLNRLLA
jgi:molecular chaperone HtpG